MYQPKGITKWWVAITFAESGMWEEAKAMLMDKPSKRSQKTSGVFKKLLEKIQKGKNEVQELQYKVTLAESGIYPSQISEPAEAESQTSYLLIMSKSDYFSEHVIQYSIDMAARFGYKILALNIYPLNPATPKNIQVPSELKKEFKKNSARNAASFKERAASKNITFEHIVMFEQPEVVEKKILNKYKNVRFIISDIADTINQEIRSNLRPEQRVCVYSVAH